MLNFIDRGSGDRTIVFLHYFGGSSAEWNAVVDELESEYRCIAIDLCGFGNSNSCENDLSVVSQAQDIIDLVNSLKLSSYSLAGHSMGGKIALAIAAARPENLQSLVLVAPSPPTPEPMSEEDRNNLLQTYARPEAIKILIAKITARTISNSIFEETLADHLMVSRKAWNNWLEKGSREDISGDLNEIEFPALLVCGEKDPNFSPAFLRQELSKYLPEMKIKIVPGTGHLVPIEAPAQLSALIQEFLQQQLQI